MYNSFICTVHKINWHLLFVVLLSLTVISISHQLFVSTFGLNRRKDAIRPVTAVVHIENSGNR